MAEFFEQRLVVGGCVKSEFTAPETDNNPYGSLLELNDINFNFSLKVVVADWVIRLTHDSPAVRQLVGRSDPRHVDGYLLSMSRQQFYRFEEARKLMEETLRGLKIGSDNRRKLVERACDRARKCLQSNPPTAENNDQVLHLHYDLFLIVDRYVFDGDESFRMVPAADSSIEGLKRAAAADYVGRNMSCSICLEEFSGDDGDDGCCCEEEEGLLIMPCSHTFHGDCIKKWLSVSHYCPLCRLEMPTSN